MSTNGDAKDGQLLHVVTLACKDEEHATRCLEALSSYGRPDALSFHCDSYELGLKEGTTDTVFIVERWKRWEIWTRGSSKRSSRRYRYTTSA